MDAGSEILCSSSVAYCALTSTTGPAQPNICHLLTCLLFKAVEAVAWLADGRLLQGSRSEDAESDTLLQVEPGHRGAAGVGTGAALAARKCRVACMEKFPHCAVHAVHVAARCNPGQLPAC